MVLVGSHARGTATAESDVDLVALGVGPGYQLSRREGRLVSLSWRTADEQRSHFLSPRSVLTEVPGWRSAVIITDPDGIAAGLRRSAVEWSWEQVAGPARAWVAAELTGYAEEVHKLVSALRSGRPRLAAAQRSVLALHLPFVLAVHFETLHASENEVWDAIARRAGEPWRTAQDRALSLEGSRWGTAAAARWRCTSWRRESRGSGWMSGSAAWWGRPWPPPAACSSPHSRDGAVAELAVLPGPGANPGHGDQDRR